MQTFVTKDGHFAFKRPVYLWRRTFGRTSTRRWAAHHFVIWAGPDRWLRWQIDYARRSGASCKTRAGAALKLGLCASAAIM